MIRYFLPILIALLAGFDTEDTAGVPGIGPHVGAQVEGEG